MLTNKHLAMMTIKRVIFHDVPNNSNDVNRVYAGIHGDGVYRSLDGGNTWQRLIDNSPFPDPNVDAPKIALGRNGAHGTQFVAVKIADRVFTSTDGGNNFVEQTRCGAPLITDYYDWTNVIAVDPTNEQVLLAGHNSLYRSTDGGTSWGVGNPPAPVAGWGTSSHADMQAVVFDPK